MTTGAALLVVGLLDLILAIGFFWMASRGRLLLTSWPDPGLYHPERVVWADLTRKVHVLDTCRIVCLNTGASFAATGLILMAGWL